MISIPGYNEKEMQEIEQSLIAKFIAQTEIDDVDSFVKKMLLQYSLSIKKNARLQERGWKLRV